MKKTLFENLKTDILIEKNRAFDLIKFVRTNDKMGKSIEDLYNEFYETI